MGTKQFNGETLPDVPNLTGLDGSKSDGEKVSSRGLCQRFYSCFFYNVSWKEEVFLGQCAPRHAVITRSDHVVEVASKPPLFRGGLMWRCSLKRVSSGQTFFPKMEWKIVHTISVSRMEKPSTREMLPAYYSSVCLLTHGANHLGWGRLM